MPNEPMHATEGVNRMCLVFGERLKALRLSRRLSQAELASQLGLTAAAINRYERGLREPSLDTLKSISNIFDVDFNSLFAEDDLCEPLLENDLIQKFRSLDDRGKSTVLSVLEHELRVNR